MDFNISSLMNQTTQNLSFSEILEVPSNYNLADNRVIVHVDCVVSKMNDDCFFF